MPVNVVFYVQGLEEGGTEKRVERLATALDRSKFHPAVAYSDRWGPVGERLMAAGIGVHHIPLRHVSQLEAATVAFRALSPDVLHSFCHRNELDVQAGRAAGARAILTARVNTREWDPDLRVKPWEILRNHATDRVTAVSQAVASCCEQVEGVSSQNIVVIHNGVETAASRRAPLLRQELGLDQNANLIGYVANYRPEKAHDTLLGAFRLVLETCPNTHLVCCGIMSPEAGERLRTLVCKLGLGARVSLLESRSAVESVYGSLDLYVHCSRREGFSNSLLEAMARGLPVVATAVGGTPEAIADGENGLLVPPDNEAALAAAVAGLLHDPPRRRKFGQAARERVDRCFSMDAMIEAHTRLYSDTLASVSGVPIKRCSVRNPPARSLTRILFHVDYCWLGGLEKKVGNLVLGLDRTRFEPILSWHRKWGPVGQQVADAGIRVVQLAPTHGTGKTDAVRKIAELAPEIFHSFSCRSSSADVTNARDAGVPFIVTARGSIRSAEPAHAWEVERNRWAARVTACSHAIATAAAAGENLSRDWISVIHNGVAFHEVRPAGARTLDRLQVGYAATYRALKEHETLLRAWRGVIDRFADARLVCCGEQYDNTKARAARLCHELGLERHVSLLDARNDIGEFYREIDIYVHPSTSEGFSNSILEAMANGLPVIATATGGTPEAVQDGVTGILAPVGDEGALQRALVAVLEDESLRRRLGDAGRERALREFSASAMVRGYQSVYEELLANDRQTNVQDLREVHSA